MQLDLVSWNLNGLAALSVPRTELALQEILLGGTIEQLAQGKTPRSPPKLIALQEVTGRVFATVKRHLSQLNYQLYPSTPPKRNYFELIAVHPAIQTRSFQCEPLYRSQYGRWLQEVFVEGPQGSFWFRTAHFDSGPEAASSKIRKSQLKDVVDRMGKLDILAGDLNLRDKEVPRSLPVSDAWQASGASDATRWTWEGNSKRARFDRCFVGAAWEVDQFYLLGNTPPYPSDHFGLLIQLQPS